MPKKGVKRLGRTSVDAARKKRSRAIESEEQNNARLDYAKKYINERRQGETSEERSERLDAQRKRNAYVIQIETHSAKTLRLTRKKDSQRFCDRKRLEEAIKNKRKVGCAKDIEFFDESEFPEHMRRHELPSLYNTGKVCSHCKALRWADEREGFCCEKGTISLPKIKEAPQELVELLEKQEVLDNMRAYNNCLALASIGCEEKLVPGFSPTFTIQGKVFHTIGCLKPEEGESPKFAQLYFYDTENDVKNRLQHNPHLDPGDLEKFQQCLKEVNTYVKSLEYASDLSSQHPDMKIVICADKKPKGEHKRKYNVPLASEVAVIMPGEHAEDLDVVIKSKGGGLQRISTLHRSYDPLHYVLLFPCGDDGYTNTIEKIQKSKCISPENSPENSSSSQKPKPPRRVSVAEYYRYRLQVREDEDNRLMKARRLTQQYATDMYAKVDLHRLWWIRTHQKEIKAEKYQGLLDAVDENDGINAGQKIILPPSYTDGPRWMAETFQDSMAVVRKFGKPDYFITFTCNPGWPEIQASLFPGESPSDRPDMCDRVFYIKHKALLEDILKYQVIGEVLAYSNTFEFQKRGLPHSHILLIMADRDKPRTPEDIDRVVSAEIPDPATNPQLHALITKHMIHGPCGVVNPASPCMEQTSTGKVCSKEFPKEFNERTSINANGYPLYKRRSPENGGRTYNKMVKGQQFTIDNRWVVPYNPFLSLRYDAHINVEVVNSVQAVKYLYKYVCKGSDRVIATLSNGEKKDITHDEVERHHNSKYIPASKAYWRLYEFKMANIYPPVYKLPLHLENQQLVYFQPEEAVKMASQPPPVTKLTAYFQLNQKSADSHHILYPDIYKYYVWKNNQWVKRSKKLSKLDRDGDAMSDVVGRIPVISLNAHQTELYYLRTLLYHKSGAKSFADLRTIGGIEQPSFQAACLKMGLMDDDNENDRALEEAASIRFGPQLRETFATILIWNRPVDPLAFFEKHKGVLCEDIMRREGATEPNAEIVNEALIDIEENVQRNGFELDAFQLPKPNHDLLPTRIPREIREETEYDVDALREIVENNVPLLSEDQMKVYEAVLDSVHNRRGDIIALDAPGGSGKTFLTTTILAKVRSERRIGLGTATSGVSATLLPNGRPLHSRLKVPVEGLNENSLCNVSKRDATAELIRRTELLVIDEVTMAQKEVYEAVDCTFQEIRENTKPFGGVTVVMPGDWRQILPVVRHGGRADIINACLKSSRLWKITKVMKLSGNMRLDRNDDDSHSFSQQLLNIGEGKIPVHDDIGEYKIRVDDELLLENDSLEGLCNFVWKGLLAHHTDPEWLCSRAVLCPTNEAAEEVNEFMTTRFPGDERSYLSSDTLIDGSNVQFPEEFLNTLCTSGMPPHKLNLKKCCPVMLIRNLDPSKGHCNGSRYIVSGMYDHVIDVTVATGVHVGRRIMIPRISTCPTESVFPFRMKRRQFPLRKCFGMTANKSQGQGLKKVGIYLKKDFFSHGQVYVAMSRVSSKKNIKILAKDGRFPGKDWVYIDNVVYPEILT